MSSSVDFVAELSACGSEKVFFETYLLPSIREMVATAHASEEIAQAVAYCMRMAWIAQVKALDWKDEKQDEASEWPAAAFHWFALLREGSAPDSPLRRTFTTDEKKQIFQQLLDEGVEAELGLSMLSNAPIHRSVPEASLHVVWALREGVSEEEIPRIYRSRDSNASSEHLYHTTQCAPDVAWTGLYQEWLEEPSTKVLLSQCGEEAQNLLHCSLSGYGQRRQGVSSLPIDQDSRSQQDQLVSDCLRIAQSFEDWMDERHPTPARKVYPAFPKDLSTFKPADWSGRGEIREGLVTQLMVHFQAALAQSAEMGAKNERFGDAPSVSAQHAEFLFACWIDLQDNVSPKRHQHWQERFTAWMESSTFLDAPINVQHAVLKENPQAKLHAPQWDSLSAVELIRACWHLLLVKPVEVLPGAIPMRLASVAAEAPEQINTIVQRFVDAGTPVQWAPKQRELLSQWVITQRASPFVGWVPETQLQPRAMQSNFLKINNALVGLAQSIDNFDAARAWQTVLQPVVARWEREIFEWELRSSAPKAADSAATPAARSPRRRL